MFATLAERIEASATAPLRIISCLSKLLQFWRVRPRHSWPFESKAATKFPAESSDEDWYHAPLRWFKSHRSTDTSLHPLRAKAEAERNQASSNDVAQRTKTAALRCSTTGVNGLNGHNTC